MKIIPNEEYSSEKVWFNTIIKIKMVLNWAKSMNIKTVFKSLLIVMVILSVVSITSGLVYGQQKVVDALYKNGLKKYILGEYKEAIDDFESALKLDPKNIKVQNMYFTALVKMGNIEYSKGNLEEAKIYYEKALKVSQGNEDVKAKLREITALLEERNRKEEKNKQPEVAKEKVPESSGGTREATGAEIIAAGEKAGTVSTGKPGEVQAEKASVIPQEKAVTSKETATAVKKEVSKQEELPETQKPSIAVEKVVAPFDIEKFIALQNEENRKVLESIVKAQREEREAFIKENRRLVRRIVEEQEKERETFAQHLKTLINIQREDRRFFSKSLFMIVGGGVVLVVIIVMLILLFLRRLARMSRVSAGPEYSVGLVREGYIKEIPELIDETHLLMDDRYDDVVKAKRLKDLYLEFKTSDPSWETIQEYINEVNSEIKDKILDVVERKLEEDGRKSYPQAYQILLPLITDGDANIRERSKRIISEITGSTTKYLESPEMKAESDPLSIPSLMGMANVADMKTRRPRHSVIVAELSKSIAEALSESSLNPEDVYRVGLAHDIGYMELPSALFKKNRPLTEEEFEIIKTHPVKGVNLLSNATRLPQLFSDGIKYHHERLDGSGYPEGLEGEAIPLVARVVAVADFFIAITSSRLYRKARSVDEAVNMLKTFSGKIFDKNIIEILLSIIETRMEKR